jgi:hypothetical protein
MLPGDSHDNSIRWNNIESNQKPPMDETDDVGAIGWNPHGKFASHYAEKSSGTIISTPTFVCSILLVVKIGKVPQVK